MLPVSSTAPTTIRGNVGLSHDAGKVSTSCLPGVAALLPEGTMMVPPRSKICWKTVLMSVQGIGSEWYAVHGKATTAAGALGLFLMSVRTVANAHRISPNPRFMSTFRTTTLEFLARKPMAFL